MPYIPQLTSERLTALITLLIWFQDEQKNTEIRNKLQDLYGDATGVVFHQVITKLQDDYDGNLGKFKADFFFPAVTLLVKLKVRNFKIKWNPIEWNIQILQPLAFTSG